VKCAGKAASDCTLNWCPHSHATNLGPFSVVHAWTLWKPHSMLGLFPFLQSVVTVNTVVLIGSSYLIPLKRTQTFTWLFPNSMTVIVFWTKHASHNN